MFGCIRGQGDAVTLFSVEGFVWRGFGRLHPPGLGHGLVQLLLVQASGGVLHVNTRTHGGALGCFISPWRLSGGGGGGAVRRHDC